MRTLQRNVALCLCLLLVLGLSVCLGEAAQTTGAIVPEATDSSASGLSPQATLDPNIETEGFASDEDNTVEVDAQGQMASIAGMTPLYIAQVKPIVASGSAIRMRAEQDSESAVVCAINKGENITVYAVYPSYVLAEYNGYVGYVIRTWVAEDMTTLDPANTPPYGTTLSQYVATTTALANVYASPSVDAPINAIVIGKGSKIAILEFVDGFAKILYWRSYGYVDASLLTDLVVVSQTDNPLSADTPIAAFASYFAYNTGAEGNEGRCKNIVRSCELMTRTLQPGETLNFNDQIGPYKRTNGYFPAPVLIDGGSQLGYGGGTCQSSSTLYNTIRQLCGVTVLHRRPHGPGCARYLPMHQDAAVGNQTLNLIIRNDYDFPLRFEAFSTGEGSICIQIFREE